MHIVFFLPIKASELPITTLKGSGWAEGPISAVDHQTSSENFFRRIEIEAPAALSRYLSRQNQTFWDSSVEIDGVRIGAIEVMKPNAGEDFTILVVHAVADHIPSEKVKRLVRHNTKTSKEFWEDVFPDFKEISVSQLSYAIIYDSEDSMTLDEPKYETFGSTLIWHTDVEGADKYLHTTLSSTFLIALHQHLLVQRLVDSWPDQSDPFAVWERFMNEVAKVYQLTFWPRVSFDLGSQELYETARKWFGVPQIMEELNKVVDKRIEIEQTKSAKYLNQVGAVVGFSALIGGWLTESQQRLSVVALLTTFVLVFVVIRIRFQISYTHQIKKFFKVIFQRKTKATQGEK